MSESRLTLSRDQLASFLKNWEQIKQFEKLFAVADQVQNSPDTQSIDILAENAFSLANAAMDLSLKIINQHPEITAETALSLAISINDSLIKLSNSLDILSHGTLPEKNNSITIDYIDLPELGPHVSMARRIQWNRDDGTLDVGLYDGVVLQVGQETHYYAKNDSGASIADGSPVMFNGAVGASGKLTFKLADASGAFPGEYLMGVATSTIADQGFGYVTAFGIVRGIDTTGMPYGEVWADGDLLYISATTPGAWTKTRPVAPAHHFPVAVVIHSGPAGSGSILARFKTGETLKSLSDVLISSPIQNSIIQWDATNSRWTNPTTPKFGSSTNYTEFEADGTYKAFGDATCFRDELNDLTKQSLNNPAGHIVQDFTESALTFKTNAVITDYAITNVQINHDWKAGSSVTPHIHWWQTENNVPNWLIQYRWQKNGQAKTTTWTSKAWTVNAFTYASGTLNQITSFGSIAPPANYSISDILQLRFIRDTANASTLFAGADPFTTDVSATSADVHIEVDMLGSHSEYTK